MGHYIAELMQDARSASGEDRERRMKACAEAVLALWQHRREWPQSLRPLEDFEPVFRALEGLDPNSDTPRHYAHMRTEMQADDDNQKADSWLDIATKLDHAARILIHYCLAEAIDGIEDRGQQWLALAKAAVGADGSDLQVIEILLRNASMYREIDPRVEKRKELEEMLRRLAAFSDLATALAARLTQQISELAEGHAEGHAVSSEPSEEVDRDL